MTLKVTLYPSRYYTEIKIPQFFFTIFRLKDWRMKSEDSALPKDKMCKIWIAPTLPGRHWLRNLQRVQIAKISLKKRKIQYKNRLFMTTKHLWNMTEPAFLLQVCLILIIYSFPFQSFLDWKWKAKMLWKTFSKSTIDLFVTSKKETTNSPIRQCTN